MKNKINGIDVSKYFIEVVDEGGSTINYKILPNIERLLVERIFEQNQQLKRLQQELDIKEKMLDKFMIGSGETLKKLQQENEKLKEIINRLQKDCKRNNDLYMKEWDKNYKLSEISKEYNARRCIEKLYRLICDDTKSVQETYITLKDEVSEFLRIHKTMSSKYEEAKQTYKQALEEIRKEANRLLFEENPIYGYNNSNYFEILAKYVLAKTDEALNDRD